MAQEETKRAIEYAEKWEIQRVFTDALTNLLVAHPSDPMGFLYDQIVSKAAPPTIDKIIGREVLDGSGMPTLEVEVWGFVYGKSALLGIASCPSCDFCVTEDCFVMLDNVSSRFQGKGVRQAVSLVTSILQPVIEHRQFFDQREIDMSIAGSDSTPNFKKLGVNTAITTSAALAIAAAKTLRLPLFVHLGRTIASPKSFILPRPVFSIFHTSGGPISKVYLLPSATAPVEEQVRVIGEVYAHYEQAMHCSICNDGCFTLEASSLDDILAAVEIAVSGGGHTLGDDVFLGFRGSAESTTQFWVDMFEQSQVVTYVEDPLPYDDSTGWQKICDAAGDQAIVAMGNGLASRVERISNQVPSNAIILRPIQCGTLTKLAESAQKCEKSSKRTILATGERDTGDTWICDLAVAVGASMIQMGSLARGENVAKVNRLMEIAREVEVDYSQK